MKVKNFWTNLWLVMIFMTLAFGPQSCGPFALTGHVQCNTRVDNGKEFYVCICETTHDITVVQIVD